MKKVSDRVQVLERGTQDIEEPNFCGVFCNPIRVIT